MVSGPNIGYDSPQVNTDNIEYAAGWDAITPLTLNEAGGTTIHLELDSTIRSIILEPSVYCRISFTTKETNINATNDLVLAGKPTFSISHEIKVPRGVVGDKKAASVYLNILSTSTSTGTCLVIKG